MPQRRYLYAVVMLLLGCFLITPALADRPEKDDEYYELFKVFVDTLDQVERNYVKKVERRELIEAAIQGMIDKLDPYSNYISPEELTKFKNNVESKFGGIGIQIGVQDGHLTIISPLVGTPAYRAGLHAGDRIIEIEGKGTKGITLDEAVKRLKGEPGTSIEIKVRTAFTNKIRDVKLNREVVRIETVLSDRRNDDDSWDFLYDDDQKIGYIRVTGFSRDTHKEMARALKQLKEKDVQGLIIDLRFNPGGLLNVAIEMCDMFVSDGKIVSTKGRNLKERVWEATKDGTYEGFPMAILVNRYSASASEIFAACLQDHDRAIVVGERTWGKGSVQNVIDLEGGRSALKLTTASYWRPNGHNIHREEGASESDEWGVMPDDGYKIRLSDGEMRGLLEYRRKNDILTWTKEDAEKVSEEKKDSEKKEEKKPDEAKQESEKKDKPDEPKDDEAENQEDGEEKDFVDRQFQKAYEYLVAEIEKSNKMAKKDAGN